MIDEGYECFQRIISDIRKPRVKLMISGKCGFDLLKTARYDWLLKLSESEDLAKKLRRRWILYSYICSLLY